MFNVCLIYKKSQTKIFGRESGDKEVACICLLYLNKVAILCRQVRHT